MKSKLTIKSIALTLAFVLMLFPLLQSHAVTGFLWPPQISDAQRQIYDITNPRIEEMRYGTGVAILGFEANPVVSQNTRGGFYPGQPNDADLSDAEKIAKRAVGSGVNFMRSLPAQAVDEAHRQAITLVTAAATSPTGVVIPVSADPSRYFIDEADLHRCFLSPNPESNPSERIQIIQIASHFNGLESMTANHSPLSHWKYDRSQGPRASGQSASGTIARNEQMIARWQAAREDQTQSPDDMHALLRGCMVSSGQSIIDKYDNLYVNGYLRLTQITKIEDLTALKTYLTEHNSEIPMYSQWVQCEGFGSVQLHVFNAAPSFQYEYIPWGNRDEFTTTKRDICQILLNREYESLAKAAVIVAQRSEKPVDLHLTRVGGGFSDNPPDADLGYLAKVLNSVSGHNIRLLLHGNASDWANAIITLAYYYMNDENSPLNENAKKLLANLCDGLDIESYGTSKQAAGQVVNAVKQKIAQEFSAQLVETVPAPSAAASSAAATAEPVAPPVPSGSATIILERETGSEAITDELMEGSKSADSSWKLPKWAVPVGIGVGVAAAAAGIITAGVLIAKYVKSHHKTAPVTK